ncbi:MAG TPA: SgcJ/EcaC family oxidoreductase [Pyrinomonadaceae bacterium]
MMKKILGLIICSLIIFCATAFAQTAPNRSEDETAIREIVRQLENGWNTHDGKAFAAPFAADADYVVANGMYVKGRDGIEKGHTEIFANIYKDSRNTATIKSVRFLRKDVAAVHVEWNLEFRVGGETKKGHAINTLIMTKESGKWNIAVFQNTSVQTARQ